MDIDSYALIYGLEDVQQICNKINKIFAKFAYTCHILRKDATLSVKFFMIYVLYESKLH